MQLDRNFWKNIRNERHNINWIIQEFIQNHSKSLHYATDVEQQIGIYQYQFENKYKQTTNISHTTWLSCRKQTSHNSISLVLRTSF